MVNPILLTITTIFMMLSFIPVAGLIFNFVFEDDIDARLVSANLTEAPLTESYRYGHKSTFINKTAVEVCQDPSVFYFPGRNSTLERCWYMTTTTLLLEWCVLTTLFMYCVGMVLGWTYMDREFDGEPEYPIATHPPLPIQGQELACMCSLCCQAECFHAKNVCQWMWDNRNCRTHWVRFVLALSSFAYLGASMAQLNFCSLCFWPTMFASMTEMLLIGAIGLALVVTLLVLIVLLLIQGCVTFTGYIQNRLHDPEQQLLLSKEST